jgi:hypothetical protein
MAAGFRADRTGRTGDSAALGAKVPDAPSARALQPHGQAELDADAGGAAAGRTPARLPVLHPGSLRADLLSLRRSLRTAATAYDSAVIRAPHGFTCARARFGKGQRVAVRYAGAPAVAVFRAPTASTQVAEVLQCGTAKVLGSVTLPPPH